MDRVIVQYRKVVTGESSEHKKWVSTVKRRYHSHDVRSLVLLSAGQVDDLVSGGVDTTLIVSAPASKFERVKQSRMSSWPHRPVLSLAGRLILEQKDASVKIWSVGHGLSFVFSLTHISLACSQIFFVLFFFRYRQISAQMSASDADAQLEDKERVAAFEKGTLLAELNVKFDTNITASALSNDGRWVAISDAYKVKLFQISSRPSGISISKIREFERIDLPYGASCLAFTPDSRKLVVASLDSNMRIVEIGEKQSLLACLRMHRGINEKAGKRRRALINRISISSDSKWLASSDLAFRLYVSNLQTLKVRSVSALTYSSTVSRKDPGCRSRPGNCLEIFPGFVESDCYDEFKRGSGL